MNLSKERQWWEDYFKSIGRDITTGKVKDRIIRLNRDYGGLAGPEGGVFMTGAVIGKGGSKLAKLIGPKKFGKATKLIEESGGIGLKIDAKGIATWKNAAGKTQKANLTERFGPRNLKMSDRDLGINPRAEDADSLLSRDIDNLETLKADKSDIVSRVSEKSGVSRDKMREIATKGLHAADSSGASTEEISRAGSFYKIGKNGEPTYLSKAVDAGNLGPDDAIIHVVKGKEPTIYQGSGPKEALGRFKRTKTGSQFYKFESSAGAKPKLAKPRQILTASKVPTVEFFERNAKGKPITKSDYSSKLTDKLGKRTIKFPSDFDKVAYNLAITRIPNKDILNSVLKQVQKTNPNITADTILQHGEKIKNRVNGYAKGKGNINLSPRSVQVIGPAKDASLRRQVLGLSSEFLFSGDTPHLRQLLRPSLTHPIKTGWPSLKRSFSAITEKGYRHQKEKMVDEEPLLDLLDTMAAIGPAKSKKLYPHGKKLKKLGSFDTYDYFGTGNLGEKVPILGNLPRASRRMFEIAVDSARATETDRMAKLLGTTVEGLAKKGHSELPALTRSVLEHTGHGPLGSLEQSGETLSTLFTAPRNTMANVQTFNPLNYLPESALPKFIRPNSKGLTAGFGGRYGTDFSSPIYRDNLKDTGKMLGGYATAEGADMLFGNDEHLNWNPLDTNFGVNFGNYRPDIFGSAKGVATLLPRIAQPRMRASARALDENFGTELEDNFTAVNAKGEDENLNPLGELTKFGMYRVRPGPISMARDAFLGYNDRTGEPGSVMGTFNDVLGQDISKPYAEDSPIMDIPLLSDVAELPYSRFVGRQFTPSWGSNVYDAFTGAGVPQGLAAILFGGLGSGSATYDPFEQENQTYRPPYKDIMIPKREEKKSRSGMSGGIR